MLSEKADGKMAKYNEDEARYKARDDHRREGTFNNPYVKGTLESVWYLSEAQKIRFEMDESI